MQDIVMCFEYPVKNTTMSAAGMLQPYLSILTEYAFFYKKNLAGACKNASKNVFVFCEIIV